LGFFTAIVNASQRLKRITSPVGGVIQELGGNSQNVLGKFVRFFCNFKVLLWSSYSEKMGNL